MTETYSSQLYRQEAENVRSACLFLIADGPARLDAQEMGTLVEEVWELVITSSGLTFLPRHSANSRFVCSVKKVP
jgi:hypothetical protein